MSGADDWEKVGDSAPQAGGGEDWEPVQLADRPTPTVGDALPEAFLARVGQGQALAQVLNKGGERGVADKLFGLSGERFQLWPERMLRSGFTLAHDVMSGELPTNVIDPVSGEVKTNPEMIARSMDMAGFQLAQTHISPTVPRAAPLVDLGSGRFARPEVGPDGALQAKTVGSVPAEADFTNASSVLAAPKSGLVLREAPEGGVYGPEQINAAKGEKYFKVLRPDGEVAAEVLARIEGNTAKIEDILAPGKPREEGRGALGTADLRSVLRQFREQHPEIEKITGERVSGASMEGGYNLLGERRNVEVNLHRMWQEEGIHPAEAVHDAEQDAFLKHQITAPHEEIKLDPETEKVLEETGGAPGSLSAAMTPPEEIPVDIQPPKPAGSLIASAQAAADKLFDVGRDIQMKLAPMARGSVESMATVKDYMNSMRRTAWDAARIDTDLVKRFSAEDRARLANAMEEESLSLRLEEPAGAREHQGLATLTPEERGAVEALNERQQLAWLRARDLGMVEGDGIAMHYPRMVVGIPKGLDKAGEGSMSLTAVGYDLRSRTPYLKQRKHVELEETEKAVKDKIGMQMAQQGKSVDEINAALEKVKVVRDIRAVNLATKQLEDAVAGRTLIKNIQDVGKRTGEETVAEGFKPADDWFTVDHPSFKAWRPRLETAEDGAVRAVKDSAGNPVFEQVPIYVRGDFEGPLRSAMWGPTGEAYGAMMALKGKTMGLIMNSPMIHNLVEFGRALPTMPLRMHRVYFDGFRAKNDVGLMHEAIDAGLVPIGKRFFNQDINAVMEQPDLTPGRSWTAKIAAAVPGLFDEAAGTAVKQAIDKAGDFWHNTLLWDRIADLQAGLYTNFRSDLMAKGMDQTTSSRIAAHWANRYAGSLPKEAMSEAATKISNFMFFSRSFTFGNLGVMKDMLTGLPKDVLAQIERDAGFRAGSIEGAGVEGAAQQAVSSAQSIGRRKAMMTLALDVGLMYAGNSVLQSAFNVMLGGNTLDEESHSYLRRFRDVLNEAQVHPLSLLQPFHIAERLSATGDNEPTKRDRVLVGYAKDGTAIYARNPVGKIGEEFTGYFSSPLDMVRKKEGTMMRPLMQILSNDAGFGRKIYDPQAETWSRYAWNVGEIAKHLIGSQLPVGQLGAAHDLVTGDGDKNVNLLQLALPLAGVTLSRGAPGGPAVGEMYDAKSRREFAIAKAMPDLRRQIQRGDVAGAQQAMGQLGMDPSYQRWVVRTSLDPRLRLSPRSIRDFYNSATEEQKSRFERAQGRP